MASTSYGRKSSSSLGTSHCFVGWTNSLTSHMTSGRDFVLVQGENPGISTHMSQGTISNLPHETRMKYVMAPTYGSPNIRWIWPNSSIHDVHVFEVSILKHFYHQRIQKFNHSSDIFAKEGLMEHGHLFDSKIPLFLRWSKLFPTFPKNFLLVQFGPHQNLVHMLSISSQIEVGIRKQDIAYGGYSLYDSLNKHLSTSFQEEFILPPFELFGNPIFKITKLESLTPSREGWQT